MKNLLEKVLGFDAKSMKLRTELIAGATTFLTMSYILAVNPTILSSTGMDKGALFTATALAPPSPLYCWRLWPNYHLHKHRVWGLMRFLLTHSV